MQNQVQPVPGSEIVGNAHREKLREHREGAGDRQVGRSCKHCFRYLIPVRSFSTWYTLRMVNSTTSIGTLRSNDATVSRNIRFNKQNNNSARASHFLHISLPFLHDCDVKMLNFAFCGERKQATTKRFLFLNFDMVPWNSTSERLQSYKVSG